MWSCIVGIVRCDVGGQPPAVSFVRMRAYGKGRMPVPWLPSATGLFRRVRVPAGQSHGTACAGAYRHGNTVCRACPLCTRGRFREGRGGVQYRGEKSLAVHMGRMLGISVSGSGRFSGYGVYVPVPLHPQRFRARGYNQAAELCRGMAEAAGGDVCHMLDRVVNTSAQALLSRYDRWGNAKGIFKIAEDVRIPTEGVIVVDDVFTTGATVCAAISALKEAGVENIAVATLCTAHL